MDLDTMLADAAPARHTALDGPDSPAAVTLYQRIVADPPAAARAGRARFAVPALAGVVAAALAAITVLALIGGSAGHARPGHGGGPPGENLAAWSVVRERNGLVAVTIRELRDPLGLWRMLRADKVPAYVRFAKHDFMATTSPHAIPKACHAPRMSDEANANLQGKIMPVDPSPMSGVLVFIRPSAIPRGIGIYLVAWAAGQSSGNLPNVTVQTDLVQVSPQCTGT